MTLIKFLPYPFKKIFTIASDCDMMDNNFLGNFHNCLNNYHGLFFTNSFWIYSLNTATSLALTQSPNKFIDSDNDINFNQLSDNSNIIIDNYHRGNLDHLHGWHDDNVHSYEIDKNELNITTISNIYQILFINDITMNQFKNVLNITLNKSSKINKVELFWNNNKIIIEGKLLDENTYDTDKGTLVSLLIENTQIILKDSMLKIYGENILYLNEIRLEGFNNKICQINLPILNIYKLDIKYLTSHGGWIHTNNLLIKDHIYNNYCNTEYISDIPSTINPIYLKNYYSVPKYLLENGISYTKKYDINIYDNLSINYLINKYNLTESFKNIVLSDHGENIILILEYLLNISNNLYKSIWYTHFGHIEMVKSLRDNLTFRSEPYPDEFEEYFKKLSDRYYNYTNNINNERIFVCGATFYCQYEAIKTELEDKIKIITDDIYIDSWISNIINKKRLDGEQWSSDLSFITIYTPSINSKLFINNNEKYNFIKNPIDETKQYSITILDTTSKTTLLSYLPYNSTDENCIIENKNDFLLNKIIKVTSDGNCNTQIYLDEIYSYNTTHLILKYETNFKNKDTTFNIILHTTEHKIALNGYYNDCSSYWEADNNNNQMNLVTYNLKFTECGNNKYLSNDIKDGLSIPIGKICQVEIIIENGSKNDIIHITDLSLYRCNPNYIETNNYLVSGIITKNNNIFNNIIVELETNDGITSRDTTKKGRYYFHLSMNKIYRIKLYKNGEYLFTSNWKLLTKNESEINFNL